MLKNITAGNIYIVIASKLNAKGRHDLKFE